MKNMIIVEDFVKKYGDFTAVDHVSFVVETGSTFAFLGPNGAGKSTTISTLCTILKKTGGTLSIDGKDVSQQTNDVRQVIGVVFQDSTLDEKMTVEENLKMHGYFYRLPKSTIHERIKFVLELVEMEVWKKAMISQLSGGMKRRIEIARSLLHEPKVLFLDEPTSGLDPQTRSHIWEYLIKLQEEKNVTIFLTTHYIEEAEICDKVAIIDKGKMIAFDTPSALKQRYTKDCVRIMSKEEKAFETILKKHKIAYRKETDDYVFEINDLSKLFSLINNYQSFIEDIEIKKGTLNDVFLKLTGREIRG